MFKYFQVLTGLLAAANVFAPTAALDFTNAQWIWTATGRTSSGAYPIGNATFRRDFFAPSNKTPLAANFVMAADDAHTLYYNNKLVGIGASYTTAQRYCVPMTADPSVFAVIAENVGGPAGLLAAIEIQYLDGTSDTIGTDATWRAITGVPSGSLAASFDDSAWPAAYVQQPYPIAPPWNGQVVIPAVVTPPSVASPTPSLQSASWVWTDDYGQGVIGMRAFRKKVTLPVGQYVDSLVMDIVVDDEYTLYVNGKVVGSGTSYNTAQRWKVRFAPTSTVVLAVFARNVGGPAGLLVNGVLQGCACGCGNPITFSTDATWKCSYSIPATFIQPTFDDTNWATVSVEGAFGSAPFGSYNVSSPTVPSSPNAPLTGAPSAPTATVIPTATTTTSAGPKYLFSFGDSYSQTGFMPDGTLPNSANPIGNPAFPGLSSSGGANWVGYLTATYNNSLLYTYNYAYGGATIDANLVTPYMPTVLSVTDQVNQFLTTVANKPPSTPWTSANSLFSIWVGINDIQNSYYLSGDRGAFADTLLNAEFALVQKLYNAGARNFLWGNVPPVDRSPSMIAAGAAAQAAEAAVIAGFNSRLATKIAQFAASNTDVNTFLWDANAQFTTILNSPTSYGFQDATSYGSAATMFWGNSFHPSSYANAFFGQQVGQVVLKGTVW